VSYRYIRLFLNKLFISSISAIPDFLYRKVIVRGRYDHAHSMLVGPRVMDGDRGFVLITPLARENGSTVLVNRGWISEEFSEPEKRNEPPGIVEVQGMLRATQDRNSFTPDNHPEKGEWFWADLDAMVNFAGGEQANVQPVFIEEIFGSSIFSRIF
jgi:surfeit locus 1 family protein